MNAWYDYRPIVTVVDVLETGACFSGVAEFVIANCGVISAAADKYPNNAYVKSAAHSDGYGCGNGYGGADDFDGGDGYSNCYGSSGGNGNGYGSCYGDGDGYGDGDDYGYGDGDDYGDYDDYGYGDGGYGSDGFDDG